jgi:hypothetical protein
MLPENPPPRRKKRPTPRYKTAAGIANARTRRAKRLGLIAAGCMPSHTPAVHRAYMRSWREKHPNYGLLYNARRRQDRANARALREAPTNSPEFFRAVLALCPKDMNLAEFAVRTMMERPAPETQAERDARLMAVEAKADAARERAQDRQNARRRQQRAAAKLTAVPQEWVFVAT